MRCNQIFSHFSCLRHLHEPASVKRCSQPLYFLKHKLKRSRNLNLTDLSEVDKQYYFETGPLKDVDQLIKDAYNIDLIEEMANNFTNYNNKRKRGRIEMTSLPFDFTRTDDVSLNLNKTLIQIAVNRNQRKQKKRLKL